MKTDNLKPLAVIFDLDGTILDNEDLYSQAFLQVLGSLGVNNLSESPHERGIGLKTNWAMLLDKFQIQTDKSLADLDHETQAAYSKRLDQVKLRNGFEEFASNLQGRGIKLALATSSHQDVTHTIVQKFNLDRFFKVIVTAEDVEHTKPDPESFLLAAEKLGIDPKDCLVFEDAEAGLEAAHAAGMEVIHVTEEYSFMNTDI